MAASGQSLDDMIDEIRRLRANVLPRGGAGELSFFWGPGWKMMEVAWCGSCENVREHLTCQSKLGLQHYFFIADFDVKKIG